MLPSMNLDVEAPRPKEDGRLRLLLPESPETQGSRPGEATLEVRPPAVPTEKQPTMGKLAP